MDTVLAAVDLTPIGRRVADRARLIAEEHGAAVTLLHVFDSSDSAIVDPDEIAMARETSESVINDLATWVRGKTSVPVKVTVATGSPAAHITRLARSHDLVVAGTSSLDAAKVGPVTRRVARMARSGLVAVRRQPRRPYHRVLATVDLSEASRNAIDLAVSLAPEAEILAAYAVVSRFDQMLIAAGRSPAEVEKLRKVRIVKANEALGAFVAGHANVKPLVVSGPASTALAETARRRSVDLVTAASKGGGSHAMVLLGTVAEELLEAAHCDVAIANVEAPFRRP